MNKKELAALGREKAAAAVGFIEGLRHVKDPWHGVFFDLLPWQKRIIKDVYGTLKPDGNRQYKYVYLEIPKKQGKSELGAALALKHLCADGEKFAEVYSCAADREQASLVFNVAVEMVRMEPDLDRVCKIIESKKRIVYKPNNSFYQALSAESYTKHGLNVSAVIFDELHAQPNRSLWDVMTFGAGDAREQPMWWVITTAGDDPDRVSIGWEIHKKAEAILLGDKVDPSWYPVIYGIDPQESRVWKGRDYKYYDGEVDWEHKWKDKRIWKIVNPSLNHTVKAEKLDEAFVTVEDNPAEERLFRQLRLNEWVKFKTSKWLSLSLWDATAGMVTESECLGLPCYGGLDFSSSIDTTSLCLLFPPTPDHAKWRALWRVWIPEDNMKERVRRDHVPYDRWVREGLIKTTPGGVIDYDYIENEILDLAKKYDLQEIGFDPWHALQSSIRLTEQGQTMAEVRQGFKTLGPATKFLGELVRGEQIEHGGHPVIRWMFGNVEVKIDENENVRPVKGRGIERIDGIAALINAIDRAIRHLDQTSIYDRDNRELVTL